jgi:hypothetical protein
VSGETVFSIGRSPDEAVLCSANRTCFGGAAVILPFGSTLHYRCSFDLTPKPNVNVGWADIVKAIRKWITDRCGGEEALGKRWLFTGGDWKPAHLPRVRIQTESSVGNGTESAPEHWAIRFEHPCHDLAFRQWRTDIGVSLTETNRFRFTLTTTHWLMPGYIGDEPLSPVPTAPGIVSTLLQTIRWQAVSGTDQLTTQSVSLRVGEGNALVDRLTADDRYLPLILVTLDFASQKPKIDPRSLAWLLAGTALIYSATSSEVDKELELCFLPPRFRCWNGMVRVYQPRVRLDQEDDGDRHRFFTGNDIDERTPESVQEAIVRGIVRRGRVWVGDAVASVDDVRAKQRERKFAELKAKVDGQSAAERLNFLEEYIAVLDNEAKKLKEENSQLEVQALELDDKRSGLEDQLAALNYEKNYQQERASSAEAEVRKMRTQIQAIHTLARLPASLLEAMGLIEQLHAGTIVFTERAKAAAEESGFDDVRESWACLWAIATVLPKLHFDEVLDSASIENEFRCRTGFELTLTEGKQTKKDKKLMDKRKVLWEDMEIDITPHVKCDRRGKFLRVHYYPHRERKLIVIGHCGDHLDTSGTRKRK